MSLETEQIKNELDHFAAQRGPAVIIPATVKAINNDDTIVIEFSDETVIDDARLKSVVAGGNKVLLIPKVDSIVLVGKIENSHEYIVIAVHEITDIKYEIDNAKFSMADNGFVLENNNASLKGILLKIINATRQILVLYGNNPDYSALDDANNDVNDLFQ